LNLNIKNSKTIKLFNNKITHITTELEFFILYRKAP
jgi:hypothetical protein